MGIFREIMTLGTAVAGGTIGAAVGGPLGAIVGFIAGGALVSSSDPPTKKRQYPNSAEEHRRRMMMGAYSQRLTRQRNAIQNRHRHR